MYFFIIFAIRLSEANAVSFAGSFVTTSFGGSVGPGGGFLDTSAGGLTFDEITSNTGFAGNAQTAANVDQSTSVAITSTSTMDAEALEFTINNENYVSEAEKCCFRVFVSGSKYADGILMERDERVVKNTSKNC